LARRAGESQPRGAMFNAYTVPLVWFDFPDHAVVVDAESDDFAFGQLAADIARSDALLIGSLDKPANLPAIVAIANTDAAEQSVAQADINVSPDGGMTARLTIALGRGRGQQVRAALRNLALPERQHFFEQL